MEAVATDARGLVSPRDREDLRDARQVVVERGVEAGHLGQVRDRVGGTPRSGRSRPASGRDRTGRSGAARRSTRRDRLGPVVAAPPWTTRCPTAAIDPSPTGCPSHSISKPTAASGSGASTRQSSSGRIALHSRSAEPRAARSVRPGRKRSGRRIGPLETANLRLDEPPLIVRMHDPPARSRAGRSAPDRFKAASSFMPMGCPRQGVDLLCPRENGRGKVGLSRGQKPDVLVVPTIPWRRGHGRSLDRPKIRIPTTIQNYSTLAGSGHPRPTDGDRQDSD